MSDVEFYPGGRVEATFDIGGVGQVAEAYYPLVGITQTEVTAQDEKIRVRLGTYIEPVWTDTDEGKALLRDL